MSDSLYLSGLYQIADLTHTRAQIEEITSHVCAALRSPVCFQAMFNFLSCCVSSCSSVDDWTPVRDQIGQLLLRGQQADHAQQGRLRLQRGPVVPFRREMRGPLDSVCVECTYRTRGDVTSIVIWHQTHPTGNDQPTVKFLHSTDCGSA